MSEIHQKPEQNICCCMIIIIPYVDMSKYLMIHTQMSECTYFIMDSHISYMYDFRETERAISFLRPSHL